MPSISYRAPLLVVSDLGAVAVLRRGPPGPRPRRTTRYKRPRTRRPAACAVAKPRGLR